MIFASQDALAEALVSHTERVAAEAIAARGQFSCALTGGSAAKALYPVLAKARIDWKNVHFFYGDERCVPADHPESNHALAFSALGQTGAVFHLVDGTIDPFEAARRYEAQLPVLDMVHAGLGPDGHLCSLFPGHALLAERTKRVWALTDSPKPPPARVTLTFKALAEAKAVWFLVTGEAKASAVKACLTDDKCELPAAIATRAGNATWFLDRSAASLLPAQ